MWPAAAILLARSAHARSHGGGCGYIAIMVFALYINSPDVNALYRTPEYLWAICLVLFYSDQPHPAADPSGRYA